MSKTEECLGKAFAGESMARNRYTYYAEQARNEGMVWISKVFEETAGNERAHAQEEYELMKEKIEVRNTYDIPPQGTTLENLRNAQGGEEGEFKSMYPEFKKIAEDESQKEAAILFNEISETEEKHMERYKKLADLLEQGKLYQTDDDIEWKCLNCGYIHKGKSAPEKCPLCKKPQGWYEGLGLIR